MFEPKVRRVSVSPTRLNTGTFFQPRTVDIYRSPDTSTQELLEDSCAGWISDPQSFCIKVAKNYLETEFKIVAVAKTVKADDDGSCKVIFDDGSEVMVVREDPPKQEVLVFLWQPKKGLDSKLCRYAFKCPASGILELTRLECKVPK